MRNLLGLRMKVLGRYVTSLLIGAVVIFSISAYGAVKDSPALHPALQWVNNNLVRGTWMFGLAHLGDEVAHRHIEDLSRAGINTVFTGFWIRPNDCPAAIKRGLEAFESVALAIAEQGMKCWFMIKPAFRMTLKDREGIPYKVNLRGDVLKPTPCPFDIKFIRGGFGMLAVEVAKRAQEWNLFGIVYDFEINFADGRCFCEGCLRRFLKEENRPYPEDIKLVYDYLVTHHLLERFQAGQMSIITSEFQKIREEVHQIAPQLMFAFYHYQPSPIYHAMIKGLGKEGLPVLVLYDFSYLAGFTDRFIEDQARAQELGLPAIFAGGLWMNQFMPETLSAHAYHLAINSAGYWLWCGSMLLEEEGKGMMALPGDYDFLEMREAYFEAIALAGREIDKWLADASHITTLELEWVSIFRPIPRVDFDRKVLVPLQERVEEFCGRNLGQTDFRGGVSRLFTYLEKGEYLHVLLSCYHVRGMDKASFLVLDPLGAFLYEGGVPPGTTREIKVQAFRPGIFTLKVMPTDNIARVRFLNQYMVIQTPFHLFRTPAERYYFYVPEEVERFQVHFTAPACLEAAHLRIFDPTGRVKVDEEGEFNVWTTFDLESIKENEAEIWSLSLNHASFALMEDMWFKFSDNIPPYVSDAPERLLIPRRLPPPGLIAPVPVAPAPVDKRKLIANPGFEVFSGQADDGEEDAFAGWHPTHGLRTYAITGGYSGEYAARLDNSEGTKTAWIFQTHRLKDGQKYVMSAYVRAEKEGTLFMLFSVGAEYQFKNATREWKRYEIFGKGDGQLRQMQVILPPGSVILVDDVRFELVEE